jgi:hypothetical protein
MLVPLRELIGALSIYQQVPQIEVAVGEESTVLVLRIMAPLSAGRREAAQGLRRPVGHRVVAAVEGAGYRPSLLSEG